MPEVRVAGADFSLSATDVEEVVAGLDPEPIRLHYAVIDGRRLPPKQVLAAVTGLDRADFTTHQARSILRRLGFGVYRRNPAPAQATNEATSATGHTTLLDPYVGRWIAQTDDEVIFVGDSPDDVVGWLRRHGRAATVWRVPATAAQMGSALSTP